MNIKTCCCIGRSPSDFPWDHNDTASADYLKYIESMRTAVRCLAATEGHTNFICDGTPGVSADFASVVIELRRSHGIKLEIVIPRCVFPSSRNDGENSKYNELIHSADIIDFSFKAYEPSAVKQCTENIIARSDTVLAFINKNKKDDAILSTVAFAESISKSVCVYDLN